MTADFNSRFIPCQSEGFAGKGGALVFVPHPDDEAIGFGEAIIRHAQNKDPIKVMVLDAVRHGKNRDCDERFELPRCPETRDRELCRFRHSESFLKGIKRFFSINDKGLSRSWL